MTYADQKLLLEYARLQLAIALSRNPSAALDVTDATVHRSAGYRKLRLWFKHLSPRAKAKARRWFNDNITGVREVMALAEKTGEPLSLADIVIDIRDAETGEALPDAPKLDAAQRCEAGGQAVQFMRKADDGTDWVGCSGCDAEWPAKDVDAAGGTIPEHAEQIRSEAPADKQDTVTFKRPTPKE